MGTSRLFVAVFPDDDAREELRTLQRKDQPGIRFVPDENWHITLRFLGRADPAAVEAALAGVRFSPAEVRLGPLVELLGDHSVIVGASGLDEQARLVGRATRGLGDAPVRKRFVGHLTLARIGRAAARHRVSLPPVVGTPVDARFHADEVALVHSQLHSSGARYDKIATFATFATD